MSVIAWRGLRAVSGGKDTPATELVVPFFKDVMPQLGLFYILLAYFVIVGTGNAVNLTDGLDGWRLCRPFSSRQALRWWHGPPAT